MAQIAADVHAAADGTRGVGGITLRGGRVLPALSSVNGASKTEMQRKRQTKTARIIQAVDEDEVEDGEIIGSGEDEEFDDASEFLENSEDEEVCEEVRVRNQNLQKTAKRSSQEVTEGSTKSRAQERQRSADYADMVNEGVRRNRISSQAMSAAPRAFRSANVEGKPVSSLQPASRRPPPVRYIKPDKYFPTTPIESYLTHFESVAIYNQWDDYDKTAHLKASLSPEASQLLWDSGDHRLMTYETVVQKLRARFGSAEHKEKYATLLRNLKRTEGQSLQALYGRVLELMAYAYPDAADTDIYRSMACDAFITALDDRDFELRVRDRDPYDLDSAYRAAVRVEGYYTPDVTDKLSYTDARQPRERFERPPRTRQIQQTGVAQSVETSDLTTDLQRHVDRFQKFEAEMTKSINQLKTLIDQNVSKTQTNDVTDSVARRSATQTAQYEERKKNHACYECGDVSHRARNCPSRDRNSDGSARARITEGGVKTNRQVTKTGDRQVERAAYLPLKIGRRKIKCLLDTGSEVCLFPARFAAAGSCTPMGQRLTAANGTDIKVLAEVTVVADLDGRKLDIRGYASPQVTEIILGLNFLESHKVHWSFGDGTISMYGKIHRLFDREKQGLCRRVLLEEDSVVPPRSEVILPTYIEYTGIVRTKGDLVTIPRQIEPRVHVARSLMPNRAYDIPVRLVNTNDKPITLSAGTGIAFVEEVSVEGPWPLQQEADNEEHVKDSYRRNVGQS